MQFQNAPNEWLKVATRFASLLHSRNWRMLSYMLG